MKNQTNEGRPMWKKIVQRFETKSNDNEEISKRRFPRRAIDICAITIDGATYPVKDWSKGGTMFSTDGRQFEENSTIPVIMKFRLTNEVMSVNVDAHIIRAQKSGVALEFVNITPEIKKAFNRVIDHALSMQFGDEQTGSV
jgi:hypothetical protein